MSVNWDAIAVAALQADYPLLPTPLPDAVEMLVPVLGERISAMDPTVRQEQLGPHSVTFASGAASWLTPAELAILRPYRRGRSGTVEVSGLSADAAAEAGASWV